jgi:hypothetical protein
MSLSTLFKHVTFTLVCVAVLAVFRASAAAPPYKFAVQLGGTNQDFLEAITVDGQGNTYMLGGFLFTTTLGHTNLMADAVVDEFDYAYTTSFLAKYNSSGVLEWARTLGNTNLFALALTSDGAGSLYVAGDFTGTVDLDVTNLTSQGQPDELGFRPNDIFLAKLNGSGQVLWARQYGGDGYDDFDSLTADSTSAYVGGTFEDVATFGAFSVTNMSTNGTLGLFLTRVSASGETLWVQSSGGGFYDGGDLKVDSGGNVWWAGKFAEMAKFGTNVLTHTPTNDTDFSEGLFLAKFNNAGQVQWAQTLGPGSPLSPLALVVDAGDNGYVAGAFGGQAMFGPFTLTGAGGRDASTNYFNDIFLAKYSSTGQVLWAKRYGGVGHDIPNSLALDKNGKLYLAGSHQGPVMFGNTTLTTDPNPECEEGDVCFEKDGFVGQLDENGDFLWALKAGSTSSEDICHNLGVDLAGNVYVANEFEKPTTLGPFQFTPRGATNGDLGGYFSDIFLARLGNLALPGTDTNKPTITITAPLQGARLSNALATIRGTARDNVAVQRVEVGVGDDPFGLANGTTNWEIQVTLLPGTNVIQARSIDTSSRESLPAARTVIYVVTSSLTLTTNGPGGITGVTNGQVLEVGRNYKATAVPKAGTRFVNWSGGTNSTNAMLSFTMRTNLAFEANFVDTATPTVMITAPTALVRATNGNVLVAGKARDNIGVEQVLVKVNDGQFVPATGTSNWSAAVVLAAGTNVIMARAEDADGNSATNSRRVTLFVLSPLSVLTNGSGTVMGVSNGQVLQVGGNFKATAKPAPNYLFSHWSGGVLSSNAMLTFTMQSNLVVQANFVTNRFLALKGDYNGLFYETNELHQETSGFFTLKLADHGSFSAKLISGPKTYPASGQFDLTGFARVTVKRPGTNEVTLELQLDLTEGTEEIKGELREADWTAELRANRATTDAEAFAGQYTLVLPGTPSDPTCPAGDGFGALTVNSQGKVMLRGTLADGTTLTHMASLSQYGTWPLYVPLYAGRGSVLGWVIITNEPPGGLGWTVSWVKPARPADKFYPEGFGKVIELGGSPYVAPVGRTNFALSFTNGVLRLSGGNLAASLSNSATFVSNTRATGSNNLVFTLELPSGLFNGTVRDPGTGKTITFKGAVQQNQDRGVGFFLGTDQSGRALLTAPH